MAPNDIETSRNLALAVLRDRHILVLCGGGDEEAPVSLLAGDKIAFALRELGLPHELVGPVDLLAAAQRHARPIVMNILYGPTGEGGALAGLLSSMGLPVTYSGITSSAIALDKWRTKIVLGQVGVRTTWSFSFDAQTWRDAARKVMELDQWPVVCKPLKLGCSIGIDIAHDAGQLQAIMGDITAKFGPGLIEPFLPGDEFSVAVLEPPYGAAQALPPLRIQYARQAMASSDIKYGKGDITLQCPAQVRPELAAELSEMALLSYRELGCFPLARVDFRCDAAGRPNLLEVNHHPGMTPHSWFPFIASHAGIGYDLLLLMVLHAAVVRAEREACSNVRLLAPDQVVNADVPEEQHNRIVVAIDPGAAWSSEAADGWHCLAPEALATTRVPPGRGVQPVFDLLYEERCSIMWRAVLDSLRYRRLGPSLLCCALAEDKRTQRLVAADLGIAQPQWYPLTDWDQSTVNGSWVAKRRRSSQSQHVILLSPETIAELRVSAIETHDWLVERYVAGDEFQVGVLSFPDGRLQVLPVARIPAGDEPWVLDEQRKRTPEGIDLHFMKDEDAFTADLVAASLQLVRAFDMPPFARVEWRRLAYGRPYFLELDHCPGMSQYSILPRMMRHAGIDLAAILREMEESGAGSGTRA